MEYIQNYGIFPIIKKYYETKSNFNEIEDVVIAIEIAVRVFGTTVHSRSDL